jgi:hypothetical protein
MGNIYRGKGTREHSLLYAGTKGTVARDKIDMKVLWLDRACV